MNWNEFQKENSWQNYAFFWPYFYDPPAPDRPLIQMMKNQERGVGTTLSNSHLMATHVQAWGRHCAPERDVHHTTNIKCKIFRRKLSFLFIEAWPEETRNNVKVKTTLPASLDWAGEVHVQNKNLNTVKSLSRSSWNKWSLRKLNLITKQKIHFANTEKRSKMGEVGKGSNGTYVK